MARLMGTTTAEVQRRRPALARELAASTGAVVVLKGARTLISSPDGSLFINPTGNPGMATGGTGDVLSGLVAALLGQGLSALDAALVGVWTHGRAGDLMVPQTGQMGLIASDLLIGLGKVWAELGR
jgi:NAD(P)H-hydrate epimerase